MSTDQIKYLEPEELKVWIETKSDKDFVVLDVRLTEEFNTKHIKDAVNVSSEELPSKLEEVVENLKDYKYIIPHCAHSRKRGPAAAQALIDYLESKSGLTSKPEILVLKGGYNHFEEINKDNTNLFDL